MKSNITTYLKGHIFVAFFLLVLLPVLLIQSTPFDSIKAWLVGLTAFLFAAYFAIRFVFQKTGRQLSLSIIDILLLGYSIFYLASGAFTPYQEVTFLTVINQFTFIFVYIFFRIYLSKYTGQLLCLFIVGSVVILSLWGLAQYFFEIGVDKTLKELFKTNHYPVIASFGNPNFLSEYLVLALPVTFYVMRKKMVIGMPILLIQVLTIFVTYSRLAWAVTVLFLFITFIFSKERKNKLFLLYTTLVIVLGIFFTVHYLNGTSKSQRIVKSLSKKTMFNERGLIYRSSLEMLKDSSFLGNGPGYFSMHYADYQGRVGRELYKNSQKHDFVDLGHVHSDFLETGIDSGYAAMLMHIALMLCAALTGLRNFSRDNENSIGLIILLAVPYSVWAFPNYLLFSKILMLFALAHLAGNGRQYTFALQRPICMLLLITGAMIMYHQTRYIVSVRYYDKGLAYFNTDRGIQYLKKGIAACPENGLNHFAAGSWLLNRRMFEGIAYIKKSMRLQGNSRALLYLARGYKDFGMYGKAEKWYMKYLFIRPDDELVRIEYEEFLRGIDEIL